MKKIAVYPGSFNPWHEGHTDILLKMKKLFDTVYVAIGFNPAKDTKPQERVFEVERAIAKAVGPACAYSVEVHCFDGLFVDYLKQVKVDAVIRGLRNSQDFEFEKTQQYWNEDLGIKIPILYIVSDRKLVHISSSAVRAVQNFKEKKNG